jgi:hypothetical protein
VAKRCKKYGKVIFETELDAKIALARRVWKDKGEVRYYPCHAEKKPHFHLSSWDENHGDAEHQVVA